MEKKNVKITREIALKSVDILEESFGVDPMYFSAEYAGAVEALRIYIRQQEHDE